MARYSIRKQGEEYVVLAGDQSILRVTSRRKAAKLVVDAQTDRILGIHMIGHGVNDLLGEASMVSLLEATTVELGFAVHAHPTLPEALKEAALAVTGEAIHIAHRRAGRPTPSEGVSAR